MTIDDIIYLSTGILIGFVLDDLSRYAGNLYYRKLVHAKKKTF